MKYNRRIQKWHKKGISLLLILLICISTCFGFAFAEDGVEDKTILTYAEQDGKVAIETFHPTASCTEQWQLSVQSFAEWAIENGYSSAEEAFEVNDMVYVSGEANQDIPASVGAGEDLKATPDGLSLYQGDGGSHYLWRLCKAEQANDEESAEESIWDYFWVRTAQPVAMQEYPKESEQSENTIEETYHVIYDANYPDEATKTAGEVPVDETEYTKGADAEVAGNTGNLTAKRSDKEVYQFLGWTTEQNATEPEYTGTALDEKKLTVNSGADITLFAVWKLVKASDRATENVCQIIRGAAYDEATGTFSGGTYVDGYPTLQEAVAALEGTGDEVIEMIADYTMSDAIAITNKKFYLTTAPKTSHTANSNEAGERPKLYTETEAVATLYAREDSQTLYLNPFISVEENAECTISNLRIDAKNSVRREAALVRVIGSSTLNLNRGTVLQNSNVWTQKNSSDNAGAVFCKESKLNITDGVEIRNNSSAVGGAITIKNGTAYMSGGLITNNRAVVTTSDLREKGNNGGGIYFAGGELYLSGGTITKNKAKSGAGIYIEEDTSSLNSKIHISGNPTVFDNVCDGEKFNQNLNITNHVLEISEVITGGQIGITVSGTDINGRDMMEESGIFGVLTPNNDHEIAARKALEVFRNDKNPDLYGNDAGIRIDSTRYMKWGDKVPETEFVCKIGNQGYYALSDAFLDISRNTDDSQTPKTGNAIPEDSTYKVEMLVEDYTLPIGTHFPAGKKIILTTAQENASGTSEEMDYRGTPGTYATINRGKSMVTEKSHLIWMHTAVAESSLMLQNIILDGQGGGTWKDDAGKIVKGNGNLDSRSAILFCESGTIILGAGSTIRNNSSNYGAIQTSYKGRGEKALIIMKEGATIKGNKTIEVIEGMTDGTSGLAVRLSNLSKNIEMSVFQMEGGSIRDSNSSYDNPAGAVNVMGGRFTMIGGEITENDAEGVIVNLEGLFELKNGKVTDNKGTFQSGAVFLNVGNFKMSGGSITGNEGPADGLGGAIGSVNSKDTITITGGKITGNTAALYGGGIYTLNSNTEISVSGSAQIYGNASGTTARPSSTGAADLGESGVVDNVVLRNKQYINVIGTLDKTAKIGITAEGNDETSTDRMTTGARFGVNGDNTQEVLDSLDHFFRDTNGTAADGIRLYGADGGMLDEGDPDEGVAPTYKVVWKPRQFTLTFDANGGDGTMKEILHDGETPLNLEGNTFTYPGHKFLGWNTKADGSGEDVEDKKQGYEPGMKDITLYAQWESTNNALTVSNVVVDAPEGFSEDFDYKLTVKVPTGSELPTSIDCINSGDLGTTSITLDANGEGKFSLKPGANIILQIPRDATYIIEQTKKNEYQTVNAVNGGTQSNSLTTGEISMDRADSTVVFTNTKLYTLTLHKAMTGDFIDSTREFAFDVTITYADNTTKTEKLTLKKDGSVSLTSPLLKGTKVTITEAAASGYSTSYVVNGDDANKIQGRILEDLVIDGDKDVVCTNHSEIAITGVDTGSSNHLPIIIAGAFLILLLMSGTILRFRYLRKKGRI